MKQMWKYFVSATVILAVCACSNKKETNDDALYVKTAVAQGIGDDMELSYSGKTKSSDEANVAFRISGPIQTMLVKEGDYVKKGQVIAIMDPRDYQVQLKATQAEYAQIKADAERIIAMYKEGNTTASNYDKARYGLEQITEKLTNHRHQLEDTKLRAPISGYIQTRLHEVGETVAAGMPVVSMFASDQLEIEVNLPASDYTHISSITGAECSFDILKGKTFPLEIVRTSKEANPSQLYTIRLRIKGEYDKSKLTPGMSTTVRISYNIPNETGGVTIPTNAVLNKNGRTTVFVYNNGIAKQRNITVGTVDLDGNIQVISGLRNGEWVVSAGVRYLTDGQKVKTLKPTSEYNVGGLL